ncbi:MAG: hypothetical protein COU90_02980 [Candidatus Ryanbacteria bacterium CG10_big_fil_rev_8_21_14_0_10_43_42]|uniref:Uncharacterized protein n=1 Tax=Candidatus Ryanbacteria bacterium CG10_big_fil_rev_8_21_14_0_10_43_42 TaxID=1974864 RepID=A0A2M8KWS6_9BACT|nr:MAG: hypothetical protein COU90_02980 [Candidatus Ryanbacteria bacterium CG10_big_fil_rev_8_21_14_0_10_43_42]
MKVYIFLSLVAANIATLGIMACSLSHGVYCLGSEICAVIIGVCTIGMPIATRIIAPADSPAELHFSPRHNDIIVVHK